MQKNIIYITGNDSYGIEQEVLRWKGVFESKYSDLNIERIRLENRGDFPVVRDNLTTTGLFADKRLFLFSGGIERKTKNGGLEEILEQIRESIPEDHFCLFYNIGQKEEGLRNWLDKNADKRKIDTLWSMDKWKERYSQVPEKTIEKIVSIYKDSESLLEEEKRNPILGHTIANALECISLSNDEPIDGLIHVSGGGKIFDLIDLILAEKIKESVILLRKILETTNPAEFLPSFIGLIRSHVYIKYLKHHGKSGDQIGKIIKVHPFVLRKSLSTKISYENIAKLYREIIMANMAYKSGKGLQDGELGRIFSIEIALMGLKKTNIP